MTMFGFYDDAWDALRDDEVSPKVWEVREKTRVSDFLRDADLYLEDAVDSDFQGLLADQYPDRSSLLRRSPKRYRIARANDHALGGTGRRSGK